jgi:ATP-dependent Clp protease ATP-binding subunit ClpB
MQVTGDTSGAMIGRNLLTLLERAHDIKKEFGDAFVSVEHLLLAFLDDKHFGQQIFNEFQLSRERLKEAITAVRGTQKVTDQGMNIHNCCQFGVPFCFWIATT